ncbi:hypothetical protein LCGC14_1038810 [marine sediment metagenome]|uniref:Uncharacterized protein n=1 Tax=marine sediment metagenome TaxID=412755 RepID=A0A0F9MSE6_9ZZZZ
MNHWIQYKFRFNDDPVNPDWWMDLFLIDTAFRDIIEKHKPELWRFHRRSGKDSVGHQLSLLCYMDKKKAENIYHELVAHKSINKLAEYKHMNSSLLEIMEPGIEKTSDANWSESLQKSWPYFITGVCQMMMGILKNLPDEKELYKGVCITAHGERYGISSYYSLLDRDIKEFFSDNAAHAFIHHISALFGYAPIKLRI